MSITHVTPTTATPAAPPPIPTEPLRAACSCAVCSSCVSADHQPEYRPTKNPLGNTACSCGSCSSCEGVEPQNYMPTNDQLLTSATKIEEAQQPHHYIGDGGLDLCSCGECTSCFGVDTQKPTHDLVAMLLYMGQKIVTMLHTFFPEDARVQKAFTTHRESQLAV